MPNLYQNPSYDPKNRMNPSQLQNHFDAFYEDIWCELCKYGELEELVVCDNNNDRKPVLSRLESMLKTDCSPPQTSLAMSTPVSSTKNPPSRHATPSIAGGTLAAPYTASSVPSPTSARPAAVLNSGEGCVRGGFCNFIHRKNPSEELDRDLTLSTKKWLKLRGRDERSASREPTPEPTRRR